MRRPKGIKTKKSVAKRFKITATGKVKRFRAGGYFGELALLQGGVRTADVVAVTRMDLLVFDAREFRTLLTTTPSIAVKMLAYLAGRLTEADAQYTH